MFIIAFLSTFLILSHIRIVDGRLNQDSSRMPSLNTIIRNIRKHSNVEFVFYEDTLQLPRRHLLENPRWIKQAYRMGDYDVVQKRYRARNKSPDDGRSYRSAVKDDEDEDEDEDEENEDEEDKTNDENVDEAEQEDNEDEGDEETVEDAGRIRAARSNYMPLMAKVGDHDKQEVVKIRSANEVCEDTSTEALQYYEYETEVKDAVSQGVDDFREESAAKIIGASLLIFLLT